MKTTENTSIRNQKQVNVCGEAWDSHLPVPTSTPLSLYLFFSTSFPTSLSCLRFLSQTTIFSIVSLVCNAYKLLPPTTAISGRTVFHLPSIYCP